MRPCQAVPTGGATKGCGGDRQPSDVCWGHPVSGTNKEAALRHPALWGSVGTPGVGEASWDMGPVPGVRGAWAPHSLPLPGPAGLRKEGSGDRKFHKTWSLVITHPGARKGTARASPARPEMPVAGKLSQRLLSGDRDTGARESWKPQRGRQNRGPQQRPISGWDWRADSRSRPPGPDPALVPGGPGAGVEEGGARKVLKELNGCKTAKFGQR